METELYYGAEKPGFGFAGWYDNSGFTGKPVTKIGANETGDKDFYARFCTRADDPQVEKNLVYNGIEQTGVLPGAGYTVKGNTEKYPGTYHAVVTLDDGYIWSDGTLEDKTIPWSIEKGPITVSYLERTVNADNTVSTEEKTCDCAEVVMSGDTVWGVSGKTTWYIVDERIELRNRPEVLGDVRLILRDNTVLNAPKGITLEKGNSLTVYAQSDGDAMGKLEIKDFGGNITKSVGGGALKEADAAIGGRGGRDVTGEQENTRGTSAGALCWKGGSLTVTAPKGACIGGGNGGEGDDNREPGTDGGNGADVSIYGGVISLDGASGIGGGSGGDGGDALDFHGGNGGNGGNGGTFAVYNGIVTIYSTEGVCIGGGNAGNAGDSEDESNTAIGGNGGSGSAFAVYNGTVELHSTKGVCFGGGNGGNGGSATFIGGTVTMSSEAACFGGGQGGAGGKHSPISSLSDNVNGKPGNNGRPTALTIKSGAKVKVGSDEATAQTGSVTETVSTDSSNENYKDKTFCKISFPTSGTASVLSAGTLWIIVAVAVVALGGVAALVVVKKKKKPALASGENTDEE